MRFVSCAVKMSSEVKEMRKEHVTGQALCNVHSRNE